jgi:nucleoid-associated protein YgaU
MQRDLKVGLSLAVLVLGVVGAFLFRREQTADTHKPTLKTAKKIDQRIAEGPRTPYMTGDVEFDQDDESTAKERQDGLTSGNRPAHAVPPNWLEDEEDPFQVARPTHGQPNPAEGSQFADSSIVPVRPRTGSTSRRTESVENLAPQTHVIQSGDSLSTIAAHYLGSQGRFQELYDANRDVLTDPNRLPLGATIVIPPKNKIASKPQAPTQAPLTAKALTGYPEKVRGTITDVSTIEPISPHTEVAPIDRSPNADKPSEQVATPTPVVPTQTREVRKMFAPSRLPFSNNRTMPGNRAKKPLDPEGEDFTPAGVTPTTDATAPSSGEPKVYQVRKGDSLEKISQKAYGNPKRAADIFAANRAQLASPDSVREGQELILPN